MKHKMAILGVAAIVAGSISACGSGDNGLATAMSPSPGVTSQSLDTAQVLAQARQSSEISSPYPVIDGALALTDTSDTTEPVGINGA